MKYESVANVYITDVISLIIHVIKLAYNVVHVICRVACYLIALEASIELYHNINIITTYLRFAHLSKTLKGISVGMISK